MFCQFLESWVIPHRTACFGLLCYWFKSTIHLAYVALSNVNKCRLDIIHICETAPASVIFSRKQGYYGFYADYRHSVLIIFVYKFYVLFNLYILMNNYLLRLNTETKKHIKIKIYMLQ